MSLSATINQMKIYLYSKINVELKIESNYINMLLIKLKNTFI